MAQSSKAAKRERQRQNRALKLEQQASQEKKQRFWRSARGFIIILVPILAFFVFLAIRSGGDSNDSSKVQTSSKDSKSSATTVPTTIDPTRTYTATLDTTEGKIVIALDSANAPQSANNFVFLANRGFYDGLKFNRAVRNFVIQTGSPDNTTVGGPGYTFPVELPTSPYEIGSVAWAKTASDPPGSAGSQFFIGTGSNVTTLPLEYGYIGKVTEGLDVAQKIMGYAPASGDGPPTKTVTMKKVTITES